MELLFSHTFDPMILISEANNFEHWAVKRQRRLEIIWQINDYLHVIKRIELPVAVHLTRIAPRTWDDDNLVYNLKYIRDCIADKLIPNKAPGQADSSKLIKWEYMQEKGKPKQNALRIEIYGFIPEETHKKSY